MRGGKSPVSAEVEAGPGRQLTRGQPGFGRDLGRGGKLLRPEFLGSELGAA